MAEYEEVDGLVKRARASSKVFATYTQAQVDKIFSHVALMMLGHKIELAKLAVEEAGMGKYEDKMLKNHIVLEYMHNHYRERKTCGVVEENEVTGLIKVAEPIGVIAGIVPCTAPSAEVFFYTLLSIKTRNSLIICPHPRTKKTSNLTVELLMKYALEAGAPEDMIVWIKDSTVAKSAALMKHSDVDMILATGAAGMVKAAYSSGNPAVGVGAGNAPAVIHRTADIQRAVADVFLSKMFDNGTPCTAENGLIATKDIYNEMAGEFERRGGYFVVGEEAEKFKNILTVNGILNKDIVGKSVQEIAALAGVEIPLDTLVIGCKIPRISSDNVWCIEKLCPLIAVAEAEDDEDAIDQAVIMVEFGGLGHSAVVHVNELTIDGKEFLTNFSRRMRATLISVNCPNTNAQIGNQYNFDYAPSMMRACGSWGKNSASGPVEIDKFMNIKTLVRRRDDMLWFRVPRKIYFRMGCMTQAMEDLRGRKKAFIVTDKPLVELGFVKKLTTCLDAIGISYNVFSDVEPDPSVATIEKGVLAMKSFEPDTVIGFGGGSPMDAAKIMRLLYEQPDADLHAITVRFVHIRRRIYAFPKMHDAKSIIVCIPTTSGTGSEVTPFAVVTNPKDGRKYAVGDYELTPDMAIIDPQFVLTMPAKIAAYTGMDALSHAVESIVAIASNEFSRGPAHEACRLIFKYLPISCQGENSSKLQKARCKMHYAATIACMSVAQVLVGIVHSLAHAFGAVFHVPHGLAIGIFMSFSIMYNSNLKATRQAGSAFLPHTAKARKRYIRLAKYIEIPGTTEEELLSGLIGEIERVKAAAFVPKCIAELGISREDYMAKLDHMVDAAFDDQCSMSNPRVPQSSEIRDILVRAYDHPY